VPGPSFPLFHFSTHRVTSFTTLLAAWHLWPTLHRWWIWSQYQRDPYSEERFTRLMDEIGRTETSSYSSWYISGVFRARRGKDEPFWVVEIYNGKRGSFVLGRLLVLGNDGRHIRSFPDERVQVTLLAPDGFNSATIRSIQKRHDNREVVELPDLDGDGYAENAFGRAVNRRLMAGSRVAGTQNDSHGTANFAMSWQTTA
jgi:hypothetical protein